MIDRVEVLSTKNNIERELGQIAFRAVVLEKAAEAIAWQVELIETLDRRGAGRSPYPYDTEGAWRLIEVDSEDFYYSPVIARSELPVFINPVREVVDDEELATAKCSVCEQMVPLIGRGTIVPSGFGDITDKYEVAVIHCNTVQLLPEEDKLPFQAHISPSDT